MIINQDGRAVSSSTTVISINREQGVFTMKILRNSFVILVFLLMASSLAGEKYPHLTYPHAPRSVATAWGTEKFIFNPAALRTTMAAQVGYYHSFNDSTANGDNAVIFSRSGIGIAYHNLTLFNDPGVNSWTLGVAMGQTKDVLIGGSYTFYKTDLQGYKNAHFWKIGFLLRPARSISIGAVANNINGMEFGGNETDAEYILGLGWRPLDKRITLAGDYTCYSGEKIKDGYLTGYAEVRLKEGVWLSGHFEEGGAFGAGLSFAFGPSNTRAYTVFDDDAKMSHGTIECNVFSQKSEHAAFAPRYDVRVNLSGGFPEDKHGGYLWIDSPKTFTDLIMGFREIAGDRHVTSVSLYINKPGLGWAQLEELRAEILNLRDSGKFVTAYLAPLSGTGSYYLASAADKIAMQRLDAISLIGVLGRVTYYTGTLDKIGVDAELEYIGKYKSLAYTVTRDSISPWHAGQVNDLLDDIFEEVVSSIAESRNILRDSLIAIIDDAPVSSVEAQEFGLVDEIIYPDEFGEWSRKIVNSTMQSEFWSYIRRGEQTPFWGEPDKIAVVPVSGEMRYGASDYNLFTGSATGSNMIVRAIRAARNSPNVRAIVLRIKSPGGEVLGSEAIYHELQKAREKMPVIVSMSTIAASGGYYISLASDSVFSDRLTMTGSIGVIYGKPVFRKLRDKIGLATYHFKRGQNSDLYSTSAHFTERQREEIRGMTEMVYEDFVSKVADRRKMTYEAVDSIAQGHSYSGVRALRHNLVDRIGGIGDAVEAAIEICELQESDTEVIVFPTRTYLQIPSLDPIAIAQDAIARLIGDGVEEFVPQLNLHGNRNLLFLPPFELDIE